jgi:hypothetical protein
MADSESFFDDDDIIDDSFPGAPSEEMLGDSAGSFEQLDDVEGLDSDTPDAAVPQEELIAKAQAEQELADEEDSLDESDSETEEEAEAKSKKKKKRSFGIAAFDTSEMTVFDAALLISLIFISLATVLLFLELRQFGNFPFSGFPWRTPGF